jgi:hypothetical protein
VRRDVTGFVAIAISLVQACGGGGGGEAIDGAGTGGMSGLDARADAPAADGSTGGAGGTGGGGGTGGAGGDASGPGDGSDGGADGGDETEAGFDGPAGTAPADVTSFTAVAGDGQVQLSWVNPTANFAAVTIRRASGSAPSSPTDGIGVYEGSGTATTDTGLTNGTTYHYRVFAHDGAGHHASGVNASATPQALAGSGSPFHAYIVPSAMQVLTGGSLSFSGVAVGGSGSYTYAWQFYGTPSTATGPGPHDVTFSAATGAMRDITLTVTDTVTQEEWSQKTYVIVATALGGLTANLSQPAGGTTSLGQGGAAEFAAYGTDIQLAFATGSVATNGVNLGNISGEYLTFPFAGTFTPTFLVYPWGGTINATTTLAATFNVTAEPSGTLGTGMRIGPLQGIVGCYGCDAYSDNRIRVQMSGNRAGEYIAVFDQKMKAVDRDDSIVAAIFNGTSWTPWTDVDASAGKTVSQVVLGEGNPEIGHQFDVQMAPNGDAVVVFMQAARSTTVSGTAPHVWANVYRAGTGWLGPARLGTEVDNVSNMTRDPHVVVWQEAGNVTRAFAAWRRRANGGLDVIEYAAYSSVTGTWTASAQLGSISASTAGYGSLDLAATPGGKVFLVHQDRRSTSPVILGAVWQAGSWLSTPATIHTPANDASGARIDVAASANGTALVLAGNGNGTAVNSVYAIRHDGNSWEAAVQIGHLANFDDLIPDDLATGVTYATVADIRVGMDDAGNALAVWLPEAGGAGGPPIGVYSRYTAGGTWTPFAGFTDTSTANFQVIDSRSGGGSRVQLGFSFVEGDAIVTYPVDRTFSRPAGTYHDQLHVRRFDGTAGTWSAEALVDGESGAAQGHSAVVLDPNGKAMTAYEVWPINSVTAGKVKARQLTP